MVMQKELQKSKVDLNKTKIKLKKTKLCLKVAEEKVQSREIIFQQFLLEQTRLIKYATEFEQWGKSRI